ncbi:MAG: site-specific DNA-methyltransferase [Planctomycetaceae bacterium]|jgi:adenine-specific DNA-methyltransferase|nr:site-specific DNA-methyltransferase [Planctomycetaceae bacterium]
MVKKKNSTESFPIEQYEHTDKKRVNNPPVGLVNAHSDNGGQRKKQYSYDPHIDPKLDWCGKSEHTSFDVQTVSLHVHERIDPRRIIDELKKNTEKQNSNAQKQNLLFETDIKPLRQAIEFYKHTENWSNRIVAGDSLLVMNSLLEKESMAGKVQMVYFDPPYGIKYGSNFQPFVNKRDVKDGKDEDLTAEPEMIKAFRDTWELGIHSYLTYIRDRLLLARELLHESGSIFVQISDENVHHIREICDEIFGKENQVATICYKKPGQRSSNTLGVLTDFIIWYCKDKSKCKYHQLYIEKKIGVGSGYNQVELENGKTRSLSEKEQIHPELLPRNAKIFQTTALVSAGSQTGDTCFEFQGKKFYPPAHKHWSCTIEGLNRVAKLNRIVQTPTSIRYKRYFDDFSFMELDNRWNDVGIGDTIYVVQTSNLSIVRCLLMTTDPGDLVLDITCGSGTTAYVAETWGRRWITCDTSRVAITLAKQRLLTAQFDYFELVHPTEGVSSGFRYKTVPHITLKSIANNEPAPEEILYDQPYIDRKKIRITGPFTVEAVPAPTALGITRENSGEDINTNTKTNTNTKEKVKEKINIIDADKSIARSGETIRQSNWKDELLRTGVRSKGGKKIEFTRVESLSGTKFLQAEAETKDSAQRVFICFGPEHAPLEQRTVELAINEAQNLKPSAQIILFCAFQFDEEAAKDIDETNENLLGCKLLKVQMNADLLTDDLRKKRSSNESFWLIGQPDVKMITIKNGEHKGKSQIEVCGFDYYDPKNGEIISGGKNDIAMWMLDTDYDGRSLYPSQVFFPMSGTKDGWSKLAKSLKAELDEEKIESFRGTLSLPFTRGKNAAVKIIDARGIESLKIIK